MDRWTLMALANFNAFANRRVFEAIANLDEEQYRRECQHNHSSVETIARNIFDMECEIIDRCLKRRLERPPLMTAAELGEALASVDAELIEYIDHLSDDDVERKVVITSMQPPPDLTKGVLLTKLFGYTYSSRDELYAMLTELGFPALSKDDILNYVLELRLKRKS